MILFSDEHCVDLVQKYHVEIPLLRLLKKTTDLRVQHAVVSILKNLSLPSKYCGGVTPHITHGFILYFSKIIPFMNVEQNKQDIGAVGAIQAVAPYLDASKDMLKPVQFAVIGILKLLAVGDGKTNEMAVYTADTFFLLLFHY